MYETAIDPPAFPAVADGVAHLRVQEAVEHGHSETLAKWKITTIQLNIPIINYIIYYLTTFANLDSKVKILKFDSKNIQIGSQDLKVCFEHFLQVKFSW